MAIIRILIIGAVCASAALAKSEASLRIVRAFYGEKDFAQNSGPGQFEFWTDEGLGDVHFLGDKKEKEYAFSLMGGMELMDVQSAFEELYIGRLCPNGELAEHEAYIRYLYRLAAISYLEEHINELRTHAKKLRLNGVCSKSLEQSLNDCEPKGEDMGLFVKSAKVLSRNFEPQSVSYNFPFESYTKNWLKEVKGEEGDSIARRYRQYCEKTKCPKAPTKSFLKSALGQICEEDLQSFQKVCSEKDRLYGLSKAPQFYRGIVSSEALLVINKNGNGPGCLARYASLMSDKESKSGNVSLIGKSVYEEKRKRGELSRLTGRLFPAGSLKRFAQAGLDSIFVEKPVEKTSGKKAQKKAPEVALAPLAPEPIKQVFKKRPKKTVTETPTKPSPPAEPKKSHFLETSLVRKDLDLQSAKVDMLKLKYDYVFNSKMLNYLDKEMGRFASRKGLEEMKKFDSLGQSKGPVPLLFIKYLIEEKKYQELFNLTDVIGNEFYVLNNIDEKELREKNNYVRLEFDQEAPFQWRLYVLAPPE